VPVQSLGYNFHTSYIANRRRGWSARLVRGGQSFVGYNCRRLRHRQGAAAPLPKKTALNSEHCPSRSGQALYLSVLPGDGHPTLAVPRPIETSPGVFRQF